MAGSFNNNGVWWNTGDTAGRDDNGGAVNLPSRVDSVSSGTAVPTAAPTAGAPLYHKTDDDAIYLWDGGVWEGPYNKGT